jgi:hypothetical protein
VTVEGRVRKLNSKTVNPIPAIVGIFVLSFSDIPSVIERGPPALILKHIYNVVAAAVQRIVVKRLLVVWEVSVYLEVYKSDFVFGIVTMLEAPFYVLGIVPERT